MQRRKEVIGRFHTLRQQSKKAPGVPTSPGTPISSRRKKVASLIWMGGFAVTTGHGVDERVKQFEAAARRLQRHHAARPWPIDWRRPSRKSCTRWCARRSGAMPARSTSTNEELIKEKYDGIRPAAGLSRLPGPYREAGALPPAGCGEAHGYQAHRRFGDVALRPR